MKNQMVYEEKYLNIKNNYLSKLNFDNRKKEELNKF